jgi:hypothetical protein
VEIAFSVAALAVSMASAAIATLSYRQTLKWRRQAHRARVVLFRVSVGSKTVLTSPDQTWDVGGVHRSVQGLLREELRQAIGELPEDALDAGEAMVEACARLLRELRPYAIDRARVSDVISGIPPAGRAYAAPQAREAYAAWIKTMTRYLAELETRWGSEASGRLRSLRRMRATH